jgi:hypothetical protein
MINELFAVIALITSVLLFCHAAGELVDQWLEEDGDDFL